MKNNLVEAEIWRTSPYEGYSASTLGNIRNDKTGRILKPGKTKLGYLIVTVGGRSRLIHRIIMDTFLPITKEEAKVLSDCDHVNNIRSDNRLNNLVRISHADNLRKEHRMNQIRHSCIAINANGEVVIKCQSMTAMAELLGVSQSAISAHVNSGKPLSTGLKVVRDNDTDKQADKAKEVA
ncbi:LysR family transcriptional regulator [Lactiplantibacillus plantarum]|uniref:helix-turn-helix domain-containing protein n=1 Tax=Lactiplantibacillus plantarum TaxID=1590 RepID=UPI002EDB4E75|nr:HNH endonuclease [Lactiplantibacillus plantarum]MCG0817000.1 HNH endonuclease [Lactiplantibacillus plantarum]MCG0842073.1 HNH endonuclease [Lactiplantibacillus plantarum]MCG0939166.1 HNH endonuclease [Lactiplantibacillus plantarum]MCG0948757.1 HNH endonuclease [Lactiplantibacillus plantarum]